MPAGSLQLDVTERAVLDDPDEAGTTLHLLGALGVRVSLDDFGSGRSSLGRLRDLPFDQIKIDRSFIAGIQSDDRDLQITRSAIDLGHSLDLGVVAEGLESPADWHRLAALGCDAAQGFALSHPLPADELEAWIYSRARRGEAMPGAAGDRSGRAGRAGRSGLARSKYGYPPRPAGLSLLRAPRATRQFRVMQAPQWQMARLMDGYLVTQMLHVAAALGVADALAERPQTSAELARVVGAEPGALHRVLRGLATEDVVTEDDDGRFALTPAGELLRDGVPGRSAGRCSRAAGSTTTPRGACSRVSAARACRTSWPTGRRSSTTSREHPEREAAFQASMAGRSDQEVGDVVDAYDFGGIDRLVDVGGGAGNLLAAILRSAPGLTGVLFDRPGVAPAAEARMRGAGVADRCELRRRRLLRVGPRGRRRLRALARAARLGRRGRRPHPRSGARGDGRRGRLLVVEAILPERAADLAPAIRMDVNMLMLFSQARERTESEFRELLACAGLRLRAVFPTRSPAGLSVLEAVPTP